MGKLKKAFAAGGCPSDDRPGREMGLKEMTGFARSEF